MTLLGICLALASPVLAAVPARLELVDNDDAYAPSMALTELQHGDAVTSVAELSTEDMIPKKARKLYEKALKSERNGKPEQAVEKVKQAIDIAPVFFQAHTALAVAYLNTGKFDEAEYHSQIALELNPHYLPAREVKGLGLFFRGKFREAAEILRAVVSRAPCRKTVHYYLGRALLKLGDKRTAIYHLRRAEMLLRNPPRPLTGYPRYRAL